MRPTQNTRKETRCGTFVLAMWDDNMRTEIKPTNSLLCQEPKVISDNQGHHPIQKTVSITLDSQDTRAGMTYAWGAMRT
jgi:hypothetical protein